MTQNQVMMNLMLQMLVILLVMIKIKPELDLNTIKSIMLNHIIVLP